MKRKRVNKKFIVLFIIGLMTIVIFTTFIQILKKQIKNEEDKIIVVSADDLEETSKLEKSSKEHILTTINDWRLIVANKNNPLPENYKAEVVEIENGYKVDKRILQDLSNMLKDARKEGLQPWICSAYRSSEKQKQLFYNKVNYYKARGYSEEQAFQEASCWIAIPGTSEHEIGLSVDIVSKNYQLLDKKQEETPEQKWLMEHCYEYGFVMRYPTDKKEITNIDYEPWHYRYVGIENAKIMKEKQFCLEEYISYLKGKI